jgi:hypothetical protein
MARTFTYPTDHLLAVVDDRSAARTLAEGLVAELGADGGLAAGAVTVLDGTPDADRIDGLGRAGGAWSRLLRIVQFMTMDQMPDFRLYEAAIEDGRAVVAVRVADRPTMLRVRDRLVAGGAHFLNFYGRYSTEELTRWRGPELDLPGFLRR